MRISDWSSDVCSSDLGLIPPMPDVDWIVEPGLIDYAEAVARMESHAEAIRTAGANEHIWLVEHPPVYTAGTRSEEHTSELQSLMRISYAVFCLKTKK